MVVGLDIGTLRNLDDEELGRVTGGHGGHSHGSKKKKKKKKKKKR